jgi:hypothetical protein
MALSTGAKVFLGLAGLGIGYAVYEVVSGKKETKPKTTTRQQPTGNEDVVPPEPGEPGYPSPTPPQPPATVPGRVVVPTVSREEPLGGWEFRFQQGIDAALVDCRADTDVTSYGEAQVCILTKIYPENRPWSGSTTDWQLWIFEAKQAVRDAIGDAVEEDVGSVGAPGWQFQIWLMFDRVFPECRQAVGQDDVDAITHCACTLMWPDYDWPPDAQADTWRHQAWALVRDRVVYRLQGPGLGTFAG